MNNIVQTQSTPNTSATIAILSLTAALTAVPATGPVVREAPAYFTSHSTSSYSSIEKSLTSSKHPATGDFGQEIAAVYAALLEKQEPLGGEFEDVWDRNVESLYES